MRHDGRAPDELRPCTIVPGFLRHAFASALISTGNTRVICSASLEAKPPAWLTHGGWITAEYSMLPGSTSPRARRDPGGRGQEIQRLIGRSLRASVDLERLVGPEGGGLSIVCDCDVIDADGGTRTASITGAFVAVALAVARLVREGRLVGDPLRAPVAAVSVGLVAYGDTVEPVLDLDYIEDSSAHVDLNVVQLVPAGLVEIQGTAERQTFSHAQLSRLLELAASGIAILHREQARALAAASLA